MLAQDQHKSHGMTTVFKDCLQVSIIPVIGEQKILHNWLSTTSVLKIDPAVNIFQEKIYPVLMLIFNKKKLLKSTR